MHTDDEVMWVKVRNRFTGKWHVIVFGSLCFFVNSFRIMLETFGDSLLIFLIRAGRLQTSPNLLKIFFERSIKFGRKDIRC